MATLAIKIDPTGAKEGARVVKREMSEISREAEKVERGTTRLGKTANDNFKEMARGTSLVRDGLMSLARTMAVTFSFVTIGKFFTSAISAASDLNETISKTATIFGTSSDEMMKWASTSANAMGLSQQAALEAASTMGNMFSQLGASRDTAGGISRDMIQLAADIASFNNVAGGAVAVSDAMQSAFRGEYDSLQRYIPTINAAAVQLEALRMTGKASEKQLTALDKALAAQKLIMEGAGVAAGDFARTSGGLANQQRILAASLTDFSAAFGAAFTPAATAVLIAMNSAVSGLSAAFSILADNIDVIGVAAGTAGTVMLAYFGVSIISPIAVAFGYLGAAGVAAFSAIGAAIAANPLGALAVGITAAVTALYVFRDEVEKAIGVDVIGIVKNAANLIIGSFVAAYEDIKFVWSNFPDIIGGAVMGGVNMVISGVEKMVNAAIAGLNKLVSAVNALPDWMKPESLENISQIGNVSLDRAANPAADRLSGAVGQRNASVQSAMSFDYIGSIGSAFEKSTADVNAMNTALAEVETSATSAGAAIKEAAKTDPWKGLRKAVDTAKEGINFAREVTGGFISDLKNGLKNGEGFWKSFGDAALNVLDKITDRLLNQVLDSIFQVNSASSSIGGSGGGILGGLLGGIGKIFGFANGTSFAPGGIAMVGERGPELVELPRGARVNTASETRRMMSPANQSASSGGHITVEVVSRVDDEGNIKPFVQRVSGEVAGQAVALAAPSIIERSQTASGQALGRGDYDSGMANYGISRQARSR